MVVKLLGHVFYQFRFFGNFIVKFLSHVSVDLNGSATLRVQMSRSEKKTTLHESLFIARNNTSVAGQQGCQLTNRNRLA